MIFLVALSMFLIAKKKHTSVIRRWNKWNTRFAKKIIYIDRVIFYIFDISHIRRYRKDLKYSVRSQIPQ